jgi:altronate dehydratase
MTTVEALRLHTADSVVVALRDLSAGARIRWRGGPATGEVTLREAIPFGHKLSIRAMPSGEPVIKYGAPIGVASTDIAAGAHVHIHNITSVRVRGVP